MDQQHAAFTIQEFCDAYRLCRESAYRQIRAGKLRALKIGRKTLILRADAEAWAAALPELRPGARASERMSHARTTSRGPPASR